MPEDRLFKATLGGLGLTGIVVAVALMMMRVPSRFVALQERCVRSRRVSGGIGGGSPHLDLFRRLDRCAGQAVLSARGIVESADPAPPEAGGR